MSFMDEKEKEANRYYALLGQCSLYRANIVDYWKNVVQHNHGIENIEEIKLAVKEKIKEIQAEQKAVIETLSEKPTNSELMTIRVHLIADFEACQETITKFLQKFNIPAENVPPLTFFHFPTPNVDPQLELEKIPLVIPVEELQTPDAKKIALREVIGVWIDKFKVMWAKLNNQKKKCLFEQNPARLRRISEAEEDLNNAISLAVEKTQEAEEIDELEKANGFVARKYAEFEQKLATILKPLGPVTKKSSVEDEENETQSDSDGSGPSTSSS